MVHMYLGAEVQRDTKTACKLALESLPRQHASVPYKSRAHITCGACAAAAAKIAHMRGDK